MMSKQERQETSGHATMTSIRIKRKIVRSVIADAVIESARFYEGVLVFCLDNGTELHVEIPYTTFPKLRDHMTAELNRVSPTPLQ